VRTRDTLSLARAADLAISAVGYNTFHELLYNRIPAIFIPQVAAYLDDQERRARAASDRGLAETVLAHELLILERRLRTLLDSGASRLRDALSTLDLPTTGNAAAARLIEAEAAR
jgi:UDP-N-acetylglucosamine:LPS N-acetylglucosamine transferase